jgi:hypothetical protein
VVEVVEACRHIEPNDVLVTTTAGLEIQGIAGGKVVKGVALRIPARVKKRRRCATNDDMELPLGCWFQVLNAT